MQKCEVRKLFHFDETGIHIWRIVRVNFEPCEANLHRMMASKGSSHCETQIQISEKLQTWMKGN